MKIINKIIDFLIYIANILFNKKNKLEITFNNLNTKICKRGRYILARNQVEGEKPKYKKELQQKGYTCVLKSIWIPKVKLTDIITVTKDNVTYFHATKVHVPKGQVTDTPKGKVTYIFHIYKRGDWEDV